ncbi:MAG TPA: VWA domain-containing protein, partial [Planctomycetota bacterium]|nr:VWA domain-containing protein [Planctomycetota bacterium]
MNQIQRLFLATAAGAATVALPAQDGASSFGDARTRELAELGRLPTPADVVVADIVNYHRHRLPLPRAGDLVALDLRFGAATIGPHGEAVLQIGYTTTPTADRQDLPPLNLGLVIDCSGSMQDQGKMDQVQRGLALMVDRLRPGDRVALVAYDDEARLERASQVLGDGRWLRRAIQDLHPGGSTNLHAGLMLGLHEVQEHQRQGGSNRVILLTDGIANRGVVDPERILDDARTVVGHGIDLSTIGVGRDLNTDLLDKLARGGHGLFHFVADGKD